MKKELDTYIYIDVSNIRNACRVSCGFYLDFVKLYQYFKHKYPKLCDVRYYEGFYRGDEKKLKSFKLLEETGYTICPLERKKYIQKSRWKSIKCWRCGAPNKIETLGEIIKYKSNVDVYLASDMLLEVAKAKRPLHVILLSCDGDYVELIKNVLKLSPKSSVTVLATPNKKGKNMLSYRLKELSKEIEVERYKLESIEFIKDLISIK